jgi:hypothetical protein
MNHTITKDEEGIKIILTVINRVGAHNEAYFRNTFNYLGKQHPPFNMSYIFYDLKENSFKFVAKAETDTLQIVNWQTYNGFGPCFIKQHKMWYHSNNPFTTIVAGAQFLLDYSLPDVPAMFTDYIQKMCSEELVIWKDLFCKAHKLALKLF